MTIAKGAFSVDDWYKFGQMYDELGEYAYLITYVPKKDEIIISAPASTADSILAICFKFGLSVYQVTKGRGTMLFMKAKW